MTSLYQSLMAGNPKKGSLKADDLQEKEVKKAIKWAVVLQELNEWDTDGKKYSPLKRKQEKQHR